MVISQKLIKVIVFQLCHFKDIDAEIECHPLESDTWGGPPPSPPRSYATGLIINKAHSRDSSRLRLLAMDLLIRK